MQKCHNLARLNSPRNEAVACVELNAKLSSADPPKRTQQQQNHAETNELPTTSQEAKRRRYYRRHQRISAKYEKILNNYEIPKSETGVKAQENFCPISDKKLHKQQTPAAENKAVNTSGAENQHKLSMPHALTTTAPNSMCASTNAEGILQAPATLPKLIKTGKSAKLKSSAAPKLHRPRALRILSAANDAYTVKAKRRLPASKKLTPAECKLAISLSPHVLSPKDLRRYGYPVECVGHRGCTEFWRADIGAADPHPNKPKTNYFRDQFGALQPLVTPIAISFDATNGSLPIYAERHCLHCQRAFHVTRSGDYLQQEPCRYHTGTVVRTTTAKYSCCRRALGSEGCASNALHVWSGALAGYNGPFRDFVETRPRLHDAYGRAMRGICQVYALDCEMSYTRRGLEVTKISVVDYRGAVVYEHFVRPDSAVVDYNSRYSGVTAKDFAPNSGNSIKSLAEVQRDLVALFDWDTILIGHSVDNDLRALRLVHRTIVDTALMFPHPKGYPYKLALKSLAADLLKRKIQCGKAGHSSSEDAQASLQLVLFKLREEKRKVAAKKK